MPILNLDDTQLYYETHGEGRPFLFNAATATWGELWKFHQVDDFLIDNRINVHLLRSFSAPASAPAAGRFRS